jgi:hypothetical protein
MARMVRSLTYPEGIAKLPPMPDVATEHCRKLLKTRLENFPGNQPETIDIPSDTALASNEFRHLLRYDAESVFWCLMWWCIQAQPEGFPEDLSHEYWSNLTGVDDCRDSVFIVRFPKGCLHSAYGRLATLLNDMRKHLAGDLDFSDQKEGRGHPEYMHEVFQRLILNFLIANKNEPFMDLERADNPRPVKPAGMRRTGTTQPSKRLLDDAEDQSTVSADRPWSNLSVYAFLPL